MEKKKLTTKQQQTKYRTIQYVAVGGEFASIVMPFVIMGIINFDEWFANNPEGWKIGLGGSIGLAVVGIAIAIIAYRKEKELKLTDGWITFLIIWLALTFVVWLLADIYNQIFQIMMWTFLGLATAFGLDMFSKSNKAKADAYKEARAEANKDNIKEKAKREVAEEENQPTE